MKKNIIIKIPLAAFLFFLVNSCMVERKVALLPEVQAKLIMDAKRMCNQYSSEEGLIKMGPSLKTSYLLGKPVWEDASTHENKKYQVVEIPLMSNMNFNPASSIALAKFREMGDVHFIQTKTCLVYLFDKAKKSEDMFTMMIVPDISYIESTHSNPFDKISYLSCDKSFSGSITYYNMEGEFVNGWRYKDGKTIAKVYIQKIEELTNTSMKTKSLQSSTKVEQMVTLLPEVQAKLIMDAKRMCNQYSSEEGLIKTDPSWEDDYMLAKPMWEDASAHENKESQVVEIPLLMPEKNLRHVSFEALAKFKETGDRRYNQTKTCLVYLFDKAKKSEEMFMMTIAPDLSYIESTHFNPFDKMSYLSLDKSFTGNIMYYNMEGEFVDGKRYVNGIFTSPIIHRKKTIVNPEDLEKYSIIMW